MLSETLMEAFDWVADRLRLKYQRIIALSEMVQPNCGAVVRPVA
jgi:hypothetical protein